MHSDPARAAALPLVDVLSLVPQQALQPQDILNVGPVQLGRQAHVVKVQAVR